MRVWKPHRSEIRQIFKRVTNPPPAGSRVSAIRRPDYDVSLHGSRRGTASGGRDRQRSGQFRRRSLVPKGKGVTREGGGFSHNAIIAAIRRSPYIPSLAASQSQA